MIADATWYLIYRRVRGNPAVHSRTGIIDAVATESVARALEVARERNPVRSCEYLEVRPVLRTHAGEAKFWRKQRQKEIKEFKELMGVEDEYDTAE